jgi:predicted nucleic acid-binding protein
MIILDTNVLSAVMGSEIPVVAWLDRQPRTSIWITAITMLEVRYGLLSMPEGRRRGEREMVFARLLGEKLEGRILPFDQEAAEQAATLMDVRRRAGRPGETRDTMIAGIALAQRATLATRNIRHFDDLTVPVVDPWRA